MTTAATLKLTHLATDSTLVMPLYVETYEVGIKPTFSSEEVYGRMDPIFTYQNTKRTFTAKLKTLGANETVSELAYQKFIGARDAQNMPVFVMDHFSQVEGGYRTGPAVLAKCTQMVGDMSKMMYPVYAPAENTVAGNPGNSPQSFLGQFGTGLLNAAPVLAIALEGLAYADLAVSIGDQKVVFIPETFTLSPIADSSERNISMGTLNTRRGIVRGSGYSITLGGTVLHINNKVGFVLDESGDVVFGQGNNFPFKTDGSTVYGGVLRAPKGLPTRPGVVDTRGMSEAEANALNAAANSMLSGESFYEAWGAGSGLFTEGDPE